MTGTEDIQHTIRRYLLGQLDDERQQRVEEGLFSDGELLAKLMAGEDELVENYLDGELIGDELKQCAHDLESTTLD